jgi:hypothetical protein
VNICGEKEDVWLEASRKLADYTGCSAIFDIMNGFEDFKHSTPPRLLADALELDQTLSVADALLRVGFAPSLVRRTVDAFHFILPHMRRRLIVHMIIDRACFCLQLPFSESVPSVGGYPVQYQGPSGALQVQEGCRYMNYEIGDVSRGSVLAAAAEGVGRMVDGLGLNGHRLYHGTCWKSAIDIVTNGIDIEHGQASNDFGRGFYVGESIGPAISWSTRFNQPAVVIFVVDSDAFNEPGVACLTLDDLEKWRVTVQACRTLNRNVLRTLNIREYGRVSGPIVCNADDDVFEPLVSVTGPDVQHCFCAERSDLWLDKFFCLVVFFNER